MGDYNKEETTLEVTAFLERNKNIEVTNQETYAKAGDGYKLVMNKAKQIEAKRLQYTRPLDAQKKLIKSDFDKMTKPLIEFAKEIKSKMTVWAVAEQKRKDLEQIEIDKEAVKRAMATGEDQEVEVVNDVIATRSDYSTTSVTKRWKHELIDINKVPLEYLMLDDKKIKEAIKEGNKSIKGLKIYQEESLIIR